MPGARGAAILALALCAGLASSTGAGADPSRAGASVVASAAGAAASAKGGPAARPAAAAAAGKATRQESLASGRVDRAAPPGFDPSCPAGRVARILDCPEVVCPCQRGRNVVVARSFDPDSGCCNAPSCDELCTKRSRCPRFACPCGVPGDKAAATDDATGACVTDQAEVCRRACGKPTTEARRR